MSGHLRDLLRVLRSSDVRELEIEDGTTRLRLHRRDGLTLMQSDVSNVETDAVAESEPGIEVVTSPLVGTFYRAGKPDMAPLVSEGSRVEDDTIVGIIEALQQLTEVEARHAGVISRVLATDGQPVEYGQVLFEVASND